MVLQALDLLFNRIYPAVDVLERVELEFRWGQLSLCLSQLLLTRPQHHVVLLDQLVGRNRIIDDLAPDLIKSVVDAVLELEDFS